MKIIPLQIPAPYLSTDLFFTAGNTLKLLLNSVGIFQGETEIESDFLRVPDTFREPKFKPTPKPSAYDQMFSMLQGLISEGYTTFKLQLNRDCYSLTSESYIYLGSETFVGFSMQGVEINIDTRRDVLKHRHLVAFNKILYQNIGIIHPL